MNKQQTIELLKQQLPGFYSVDQVIDILKGIDEDTVKVVEFNDELINTIVDEIADAGKDLIDDYELEINYREVELSSIDVNTKAIKRCIQEAIDTFNRS
jgi:hypothetical protein